MPTLTVENYLKAIYQICGSQRDSPASTGAVAKKLGVSPSSVTTMLQGLAQEGLVEYQSYEGSSLTPQGTQLALRVIRRHRLLEVFLVRTLGMSWDEVHEEAEVMEHAVSDRLIDRIDESLGFPTRDPHGDPIPHRDGTLPNVGTTPLIELGVTSHFSVERVLDQTPGQLRYLSDNGLSVGCIGSVHSNDPYSGAMVIESEGRSVSLGREAAGNILVRVIV